MASEAKLKARKARGFVDRGPGDVAATEAMLGAIRKIYEIYGFEAVETPLVEYTDALGKFLPDQDRPNEGVFSLQDDDEQWLSLRYDLTAPLARYAAENWTTLPKPYRSYRCGWVFRNEKPGPGRFRQFMQFDADTVGTASVAADAEICMMMADAMEAVGLKRGQYVVKVNNRKVLDGLMESIGVGGDENAGRRLTVLRAIDKLDKVGPEGVRDLLGEGRWENPKDKSGDFTKGAGLARYQIDPIISFLAGHLGGGAGFTIAPPVDADWENDSLSAPDNLATVDNSAALFRGSMLLQDGLSELKEIEKLVRVAGYGPDRIRIDPSVVRGLEYYTGPVYEAELTFEVPNEDGQIVRFGSVGGGGRYDGLVSRFLSEPVPSTGFSIGVSRLLAALKAIESPIVASAKEPGPVVVLVMKSNERDPLPDAMALAKKLREAGIRAEAYLGSSGMKPQMKYADRRGAPCVIIQGDDEKKKNTVQIKDLIEGAEAAKAIASNAEYKAARPAQVEVAEADMVETVRAILARHA